MKLVFPELTISKISYPELGASFPESCFHNANEVSSLKYTIKFERKLQHRQRTLSTTTQKKRFTCHKSAIEAQEKSVKHVQRQ